MEMTGVLDTGNSPTFEDFPKMKVADLKKELKNRGLLVSGTKGELVERLQNYLLSEKSDVGTTDFLEVEEEELEAEQSIETVDDEILNDDSDIPKIPEPIAMPLKKRILPHIITAPETVEKKITLNRKTDVSLSISSADVNALLAEPVKSNTSPLDKNTTAVQGMSDKEKIAMRAERFHSSSVGSGMVKTKNGSLKADLKLAKSGANTDLEVLKKRAERFGGSVSNVMKQMEAKERVLKRKIRFGASVSAASVPATNANDKKKLRAERFAS